MRQLETRLTPSLTALASFGFPNGFNPDAALVMDGSGNLYGTTEYGGPANAGSVFELAHGSRTLATLAFFNGTDGSFPEAALILDGSGNLYGTTVGGGLYGDGTVFELAKGSGTITTLASFTTYSDSAHPPGSLVLDASGNLYGTTQYGGDSNDGTVYEVAAGSGTLTTLASFDGTHGANPYCGLVMDGSGNLYGTTAGGGASSDGTVFELAQGSGTITTLASFSGSNGISPEGNLVLDGGGNLYGTAVNGGAHKLGTVFEVAAGSGTITALASFSGTDGSHPLAGLVMDAGGNLYGTASAGGSAGDGTVFKVAAASGTITRLVSFDLTNGTSPYGGLVLDGSGNLYGTTFGLASSGFSVPPGGGPTAAGTVFELAHGSRTISTLAAFLAPNGSNPFSKLIIDGSGNLFGTTQYGGAFNDGTVFEVPAGSGTITTLASFNGTDGQYPVRGSLVLDGSGNLYGTARNGGASGYGTVFELAKGSGTIATLVSFNGTDGRYPDAALIMDSSGNLYGTTSGAPALGGGYGTVFEVVHGSGKITTLASFNINNGGGPSGVIMDASGNLYGTTLSGGAYIDGTVFELAKGSGTITTLATFNGANGQYPNGGLVMDGSGDLFGTTNQGGALGLGTVFALARGSGTITSLASFDLFTNGADPTDGLVMDSFGNLYGTAGDTLFEVAVGSSTITTVASLDWTNGANAYAGLLLDSQGNLYGTATVGGALNGGTVFELPGSALPDQWTGANFAVDTNWSDGANWSTGSPPNPAQTVLFTNNASVKDFTSTVDAGFTNPIGLLSIDSSWGGTIAVNSPLSVLGDFALASGSIGGSGAVTAGSGFSVSPWTGGQIDLGSGGFTTYGTFNADTTAGNLVLTGAGTLTNYGMINEAGTHSLLLENGATLANAAGATFDLTTNGGISQSGGGTLTNAGTLEKTGGTGTSTIATSTLSNTGTVAVTSGTLDIAATVSQVSGKTLTAGAWTVTGSSKLHAKLDITSAGGLTTLGSGAQVTLSGLNSVFSNVSGLTTIDSGASFSLLGGQSFTTTGALTNNGSLTLGPGSILTVGGDFTQTSTGALTIECGGTNKNPTYGQLVLTGLVALAGSLNVTSAVVPAVGSSFALLDNEGNSAIFGGFAGLAEGSTFTMTVGTTTMTFQITYASTDSDGKHNVVITRMS